MSSRVEGGRSRPFPIVTLGRSDTVDVNVAHELIRVLDGYLERQTKSHGDAPARVRELAKEFKQLQLLLRVLVHKNFEMRERVPKKAQRLQVIEELVRLRLAKRRRREFNNPLTSEVRDAVIEVDPKALDRQTEQVGSRRWSENPNLATNG